MSGTPAPANDPGGVYLRSFLAPLADALAREDVTDIFINRPGELWLETIGGGLERQDHPRLDELTLARLARQLAALTHQGISREHPLLSATLPDGSRIQIVSPPATRGPLALAIRKHIAPKLGLSDYMAAGAFAGASFAPLRSASERTGSIDLQDESQAAGLLAQAVRDRKNILVSGGTSTGKTTFLNALLAEVPADERLILIEDTPELSAPHHNQVGLIAVRGGMGEAKVGADDLVAASLRMRPDRIILGELRGIEALAFLRAVNSGHPGSMTTIHADSPEAAIDQLALLVLQAGTKLGRADVREYVSQTIDVYVQLTRRGGRRQVERVVIKN
ncbi:MAG: P-type DNA transfer ATPase VirB11 [Sphingomicrobium sp.]